MLAVFILLATAGLALWLDQPSPPVSGTARASDGDSFRLGPDRIRLLGIDAPELAQSCESARGPWPCGVVARDRMAALLASGPVQCIPQDHDQYDRLLARCSIHGADLGAMLVGEGLAISAGAYWQEEAAARQARRGIWAGAFERPTDWRQDNAQPRGLLEWLW